MINKEKDEVLEPIKKGQITAILETLSEIYQMTRDMKKDNKLTKTFALGGRFLGDVGECLVSYLFGVKLYNKQQPGEDGIDKNDKPVEIKVRTRNGKNEVPHIHISKNTRKRDGYLIVLSFESDKPVIHIEINSYIKAGLLGTEGGFIDFKDLKGKCGCNGLELQKKDKNIAGWEIVKEYSK